MPQKLKIFKLLKIVIAILTVTLLLINLLYLKIGCTTKQCLVVNVSTMLLLLWVAAFWFVVVKYIDKEKK